jgi:hypothetical protein
MRWRLVAAALAAAGLAAAQTQVDLKSQSKNVNFSAASGVIPFPTGTVLPASCPEGSMFFNLSAPAGSNLYGCTAVNTWSLEAGGGGGGATVGVFTVQQASSTAVMIGGGCAISAPCLVQVAATVYLYTAAATLTLASGTGTVYLYISPNGNITAGESSGGPSLSCAGCVLASPVTQFPVGTVPLATWSAAAGAWVAGTSEVALEGGGPSFSAGSNITLTQTGTNVMIAASLEALPSGAQPVCAAATGGFMWYTQGATGVKDTVQVCAKDATNTYAWRTLY